MIMSEFFLLLFQQVCMYGMFDDKYSLALWGDILVENASGDNSHRAAHVDLNAGMKLIIVLFVCKYHHVYPYIANRVTFAEKWRKEVGKDLLGI